MINASRISFTSLPARRAALADEAKALYAEFCSGTANSDRINWMDRINSFNPVNPVHPVQTGASSGTAPDSQNKFCSGTVNSDGINWMDRINSPNPVNPVHPVQTGASSGTAPDSQKVLDFVGMRLSAEPQESDAVHDLLAHLAECMIEMNKEKNAEITGFLRWLEGEIGAPVEELANKTAIKKYYLHGFEGFFGALAKNKKKLKVGYDVTRREPKERLQQEYGASMAKLAPLLGRIEATDGLIDAIVYRLYGLNEDEIKIVEESISGGRNAEDSKTKNTD